MAVGDGRPYGRCVRRGGHPGPPASAAPVSGLTWLLFLGSSAHVASTGWLYTLPDVRAHALSCRLRYVFAPAGLVAMTAAVAAVLSPTQFAWLLLPYLAWQFFHFQKQNLGMAALAASSHGLAPMQPGERRALSVASAAGIAALMARPSLAGLGIDLRVGVVFDVAAVVFAGAVVTGTVALSRRPTRDRPLGFCTVYLLSLLFSLPVFVFGSPYAAVGGMTIARGLQYLLLVGIVAAGGPRGTTRTLRLAVLCNIALVGGTLLSAASHLHGSSPAGRLLFGAYLGAVMAHFVVDAGLWRLRDPFPRSFIVRYAPYLVPPSPRRSVARAADESLADIG